MVDVLVTGGAGFIGSHLVRALLAGGDRVRVLDNLSTGSRENLAEVRSDVEFHEGDLRDLTAVTRALTGVDSVLHQGALPSVPRSLEDPRTSHEVNVTGTFNLLLGARDAGVRRVVLASSSSVYGEQAGESGQPRVKVETMTPTPLSPYAATKLIGETYARVFARSFELSTVCLRYFNVFGPRQDPASTYAAAVPRFVTALLAGRAPTVYGDGTQSRDFTYVENVVQANLAALASDQVGQGEVINVASGRSTSVLALIAELNRLLGTSIEPRFEPPRAGDIRHSLASIQRAQQLLGYEPSVRAEDGLARTLDWYRASATA